MTGQRAGHVARAAAASLAGRPEIRRRAAQRLARRELAEVSVAQRIIDWLRHLLNTVGRAVPGGWFGILALLVLGVLAVSAVLFWVRPVRAGRAGARSVLGGTARSAADYRAEARRLATAGDFTAAIVEAVRAIVADLEERQVLPAGPARTAGEFAAEASRRLPGQAAELRAITRLFDDVRYGGRTGTSAGYERVRGLDRDLSSAKPADVAHATTGWLVPR